MLAVKFLHLTSVNASEKTFICNCVFVMSHLQSEEEKNEPYTCKGQFIKLNFNLYHQGLYSTCKNGRQQISKIISVACN